MRFAHVFTVILSHGGLILMLLSLFAGSNMSFMENADIMTVDLSGFGQGSIYTAATLGLSDFYKVHVLDFCQGQFEPNATADDPKGNVTSCSSTQAGFYFDLSKIIADGLPPGATLGNLSWPSGITDAGSSTRSASTAMFFFFVVGIACAVFSIIAGLWGVFSKRTLSSVMAFATSFIGFLNSGLAAACATALSVNEVNNINTYGNSLGISANVGVGFLGMAWAAAASLLGAAIFAGAQGFAGRNFNGFKKISVRHMRVPRFMRHPGMGHHAMQYMGTPHPAMHPAIYPAMQPTMHPAMYPAMHPAMHPAMGQPSVMNPPMAHPSMMYPPMAHPSMMYPFMAPQSMASPYMGHQYYG